MAESPPTGRDSGYTPGIMVKHLRITVNHIGITVNPDRITVIPDLMTVNRLGLR